MESDRMEGVQVIEEAVATDLGFKDVNEFRRWQTDVGRENAELKHALKQAKDEAERFRWHGMRSAAILEHCRALLEDIKNDMECGDTRQLKQTLGWYDESTEYIDKFLLAIGVVSGSAVDWDHKLADWLDYLNPLRIRIDGQNCTVTGILDGGSETRKTLEMDLATFTGPKLIVTADHVGLVVGGVEAWLDNVPKTCRITYKMSQFAMNIYDRYPDPFATADFDPSFKVFNPQHRVEPAASLCLVKHWSPDVR